MNNETQKGQVGITIAVVAGIIILALAIPFIDLVLLPWFKFKTQVGTNYNVIQKTYDANNVIYNYEWFKDRYEAIGAIDNKIANAKQSEADYNNALPKDRTTWAFEQQTESSRLHSVVLGLQNQKEDLVAEYNANAKKVNRNIFQDKLPLFINL